MNSFENAPHSFHKMPKILTYVAVTLKGAGLIVSCILVAAKADSRTRKRKSGTSTHVGILNSSEATSIPLRTQSADGI